MNAEQAYNASLIRSNNCQYHTYTVREALSKVEEATRLGQFECIYWNDDKARDALRKMGYTVSEMWKEDRWYQTEYMTINWFK